MPEDLGSMFNPAKGEEEVRHAGVGVWVAIARVLHVFIVFHSTFCCLVPFSE